MSKNNKKKKKSGGNPAKKVQTKQKGKGFKTFTRIGAIVLVVALAVGMVALYI